MNQGDVGAGGREGTSDMMDSFYQHYMLLSTRQTLLGESGGMEGGSPWEAGYDGFLLSTLYDRGPYRVVTYSVDHSTIHQSVGHNTPL